MKNKKDKYTFLLKPGSPIFLNGVKYEEGKDYTISGYTVTFKKPIKKKDVIISYYQGLPKNFQLKKGDK